MKRRFAAERDADAGFFEDWSEWVPGRHDGCWVDPKPSARVYYLRARGIEAARLIGGHLGDRGIPGAMVQRRHPHDAAPTGYWYVPAASWHILRQRLPAIAAASARAGRP